VNGKIKSVKIKETGFDFYTKENFNVVINFIFIKLSITVKIFSAKIESKFQDITFEGSNDFASR